MKILRFVFLALLIALTVAIVYFAPKMHRQVRLEKPDFEVGETIVWNNWYSNLSNYLLKTVSFPNDKNDEISSVYVKFDVKRDGSVVNISTKTTPPDKIDIAQKYVVPVVQNLQGNPLLKFPVKSKKQQVTYEAEFIPSSKTHYTTPSDFQSYEKIN